MGLFSKFHVCEEDHEEAILLVDLETESIPETDEEGNLLYYCPGGQHTIAVDSEEDDRRWRW